MKFQVLQEKFSKALITASRFATSKAQLPVLGNILIKTQKNKILVNATNLELSISISVGAQVEKEGSITVPAKTISEIISNLPNKPITFEVDKEQLGISSENFSSNLLAMNAADFPPIPETVGKDPIEFPSEKLDEALSKILFSVSVDESRYVLTGALFIFKKGSLNLVSTDGFRLSKKKIAIENVVQSESIIIPKSILLEILKLSAGEDTVRFSYNKNENQLVFGLTSMVVSSRVIDGEFPDFEKIIPKSSSFTVDVDKEELLRAIKVSSVFARDAANVIKFKFKGSGIEILAESKQTGNQKAIVDAKVEGDTSEVKEIAFNYRFVEDLIGVTEGESVNMAFSGSNAPGVFTDPKDKDYLHLIMPVRIEV